MAEMTRSERARHNVTRVCHETKELESQKNYMLLFFKEHTRIMISKGMVSKGQYSKFGTVKGFQYSF